MSAVVTMLSPADAQRLTQRIKLIAGGVRDNLFKLRNLVDEAKASNAWQVLGFSSWTAYLSDTLASEPMRLERTERDELVGYLSGEGMSSAAIAPMLGITDGRVRQIAREVGNDYRPVDQFDRDVEEAAAAVRPPDLHFNPATGEVLEEGTVSEPVTALITETTETFKTKVTTGLDGKQYAQKAREPKPTVLNGDAAAQLNREEGMQKFSTALFTLWQLTFPTYREYLVAEVWPLASESVPPDDQERATPETFRAIAVALNDLADEWEKK